MSLAAQGEGDVYVCVRERVISHVMCVRVCALCVRVMSLAAQGQGDVCVRVCVCERERECVCGARSCVGACVYVRVGACVREGVAGWAGDKPVTHVRLPSLFLVVVVAMPMRFVLVVIVCTYHIQKM